MGILRQLSLLCDQNTCPSTLEEVGPMGQLADLSMIRLVYRVTSDKAVSFIFKFMFTHSTTEMRQQ